MLRELRIENLAIIDQLGVEFHPGLNILTGETGAGKSIILDALRLVLGERAASEDVRTGAESAIAEALVEIRPGSAAAALLAEADLAAEDGELVLRREVALSGKSKACLNGRLTPIHQLHALGETLVDLHGQHQHQSLLDPENHLAALDAYAGDDEALRAMAGAFEEWRQARQDLQSLLGDERALEREKAMLEHQIREIRQADLRPGEDEALTAERSRLRNADRLQAASSRAHALLREGAEGAPAALELVGMAEAELARLAEIDPLESPARDALAAVRYQLEDLADRMRDYALAAESDPRRLEAVEDRLDLIRNLSRKYGESIEHILGELGRYETRLASLANRGEEIERLRRRLGQCEAALVAQAESLSAARQKAARRFEKNLLEQLAELNMKSAQFAVSFWRDPAAQDDGAAFAAGRFAVTAHGVDRVEFLLSTNPGESLKPLRRVASGGELSRIMLAIKSLLAARDRIPTLVFDEIDAGISGQTAQIVGEKLRKLARSHQVVCITHLPQIASRAQRHFAVEKVSKGKRVATRVRQLGEEDRVAEIARLLGGDADSDLGREHARALLAEAARHG